MKENTSIKEAIKSPSYGWDFRFDEKRDIKQVESGLSVDVASSLKTGIVKAVSDTAEVGGNGISHPDQIVGRVQDIFDVLEASRIIKKYGKKSDLKPAADPSSASSGTSTTPSPSNE